MLVPLVAALAGGSSLAGEKAKSKNRHGDGRAPAQSTSQHAVVNSPNASTPTEPWLKVDVSITPHERKIIQTYVDNCCDSRLAPKKQKSLPPGLAKKVARGGRLPPGWQRKCAQGEVLPVEVYRQSYPLPPEVLVTLPPPPPGTILVAVSGKIIRVLHATREILDVFDVHL